MHRNIPDRGVIRTNELGDSEANLFAHETDAVSLTNALSVVDVIEKSLPETLSVVEIARRCLLSRSNLQRQFKKQTGLTITQYQRMRLLSLAAGEIANTERRILDIALDYGFESQEAFARAFKRFAWVAPKNLRGQPVWAARIEFPALDNKVLEKLAYLNKQPLLESNAPATRWACYGIDVDSLARRADEMDAAIYQSYERFYKQPFSSHFEGQGSYIVEFWEHCQFAKSRIPLAIGFQLEAEQAIPAEMVEVHVQMRRMMTISVPSSDYVRDMLISLPNRLLDEFGLKMGPPPYLWRMTPDFSALHFTFSVEEVGDDSLEEMLALFSASLEVVPFTVHGVESLALHRGQNLGTRRVATLFNQFQDRLTAVALQEEGKVFWATDGQGDDTETKTYFTSTMNSETRSFEGLYLVSDWEGENIYRIESEVEKLYHALKHSPTVYPSPGVEVIRNISMENGYCAFQLLTPVHFRRGSGSI